MSPDDYYADDSGCTTVWVEGGLVRMVTNIPPGVRVRVVDEDHDGLLVEEDPCLEPVNGRAAWVTYWPDAEGLS